jgi:hypothetical protein
VAAAGASYRVTVSMMSPGSEFFAGGLEYEV